MPPLLEVQGLRAHFFTAAGVRRAVDGVDFSLDAGETLALVGESGCGKTVTALSLLRLVDPPGRIVGGRILWEGRDILSLPPRELRRLRGAQISMIFQEPSTALNPVLSIGCQIAETLRVHRGLGRRQALSEAARALEEVRIPEARLRVRHYPHQFSGGMCQRAMIALALSCGPRLLLADEPTTALDVTIQAQILDLLRRVQEERGLAVLLITHDLGIVARMASRVAVMYAGRIVEEGPVREIFHHPLHPYTRGLLRSLPAAAGVDSARPSGRRLAAIEGSVPDLARLPDGCPFEPRCLERLGCCREARPGISEPAPGRRVRCFLHGEGVEEGEE